MRVTRSRAKENVTSPIRSINDQDVRSQESVYRHINFDDNISEVPESQDGDYEPSEDDDYDSEPSGVQSSYRSTPGHPFRN